MFNSLIRSFSMRGSLFVAFFLLAIATAGAQTADDASAVSWVSTWGTSVSGTNDSLFAFSAYNGNNVFNNQVIRETVHASLGGAVLRVRLSNEKGTAAVLVGAAHIALTDTAANIVPGTDRTLTFRGGSASVTIPAGSPELSDAVDLDVPANANLSISLYFPASTPVATFHPYAMQTTYVSPPNSGDVTGATTLPLDSAQPVLNQWSLIGGVEVQQAVGTRAFVALGSSITDGYLSTQDTNHRWTDYLALRFARKGLPVGIVNASLIANPLVRVGNGDPVLVRFDRDVLARPGAAYVFLNDVLGVEIQTSGSPLSDADYAQATIGALRQYRTRAHSLGLKAYAGTIIPLGGAPNYTTSYETKRQIVNAFIRNGGLDGYADFDAAVRDPADPTRILAAYDGGDHHHLNDAGYKALAHSFDLALFQ